MKTPAFDKIRILWIDDRELVDGQPEKQLPSTNGYREYFWVAHPSTTEDQVFSYRTASDFMEEFNKLWYENEETPCETFPVEIIAADYNLTRKHGATEGTTNSGWPGKDEKWNEPEETAPPSISSTTRNFDGLQIGVFYATMTERHPAALVSITHYMTEMPSGVDTLHELAAPLLGTNFEKNLGNSERCWENIIQTALEPLRDRIEHLFERGDVQINTGDLLAASKGKGKVLSIISPYATRQLPLHGLFFDFPEEVRDEAIVDWAKGIYDLTVQQDLIQQAEELADAIWDAGKDETLVRERQMLSYHVYCLEQKDKLDPMILKDLDEAELKRLSGKFGLKKGDTCGRNCFGVNLVKGKQANQITRWACTILLYKFCKAYLQDLKKSEKLYDSPGSFKRACECAFDDQDIYSLFFPVPDGPAVLAADRNENNADGTTLGTRLRRLKDTNGRSIRLKVDDVLNGEDWRKDSPYGLTHQERHLIRKMIIEDQEAGASIQEQDWWDCKPTRLIAWGKRVNKKA